MSALKYSNRIQWLGVILGLLAKYNVLQVKLSSILVNITTPVHVNCQ